MIIVYVMAWLLIGLVIAVLDQAYSSTKSDIVITLGVIGWPVILQIYLLFLIYRGLKNSGIQIRQWGLILRQRWVDKQIAKESQP